MIKLSIKATDTTTTPEYGYTYTINAVLDDTTDLEEVLNAVTAAINSASDKPFKPALCTLHSTQSK